MLTHYGLAGILSAVVPTGGPPMGRIDWRCLLAEDPGEIPLIYRGGSRDTIDRGFGFYDGDGPCARRDQEFRRPFKKASVAARKLRNYVFPQTLGWFVFGENDRSNAVGQGLTFYDRLLEAGSPLVEMSIAVDTPHATPAPGRAPP